MARPLSIDDVLLSSHGLRLEAERRSESWRVRGRREVYDMIVDSRDLIHATLRRLAASRAMAQEIGDDPPPPLEFNTA